jgi:hypothetical protein
MLDVKSFAGNALAEFAGAILSVLAAVLVLDRLVENDRRRRWNLVAEETVETLRLALIRAGVAMYLRLDAPRPPSADPFTMAIAGPEELVRALRELGGRLRGRRDTQLGEPDEWLPEVEEQIRLIREGVMPRLLAIGDEDIVAAVAGVEGRFEELLYAAWAADRFGGEHIAAASAQLSEAMGQAAAVLSR